MLSDHGGKAYSEHTGYPSALQELKMVVFESVITCPHCATARSETMPADACRFFYECTVCGARLRPKEGDCCVFCSYGSVSCPPVQRERARTTGVRHR